MKKLNETDVQQYVEDNIGNFHAQRIESLNRLKLKKILEKKNPYLFKAKYLLTTHDIVKSLTDAYLSSQEETMFGTWLEGLAIFVNEKAMNGRKSGIEGIDLEFDNENTRYIVAIKSGPNWGNASQIKKLKSDFMRARITLKTSNSKINVEAVNGCCYGKKNTYNGAYYVYCGQKFWEFISEDPDLFVKIIEPLGFRAKERNDEFTKIYSQLINRFIIEFSSHFCKETGEIDWEKLVRFNSSISIQDGKRAVF